MHRDGCGSPGASGRVSPNATVQLETTEKWPFQAWVVGCGFGPSASQPLRGVHADP